MSAPGRLMGEDMRITAREAVGESDFFEKAERKFAELTQDLRGRQTQAMDFSELEKRIEKEGRELLRLMLEAHLNARGMGDIGPSIEGADNVLRTHRRIGGRQIRSIFGTIEFERLTYGGRGEESLFPKDAHLNLPAEQMHSHEFQRRVALEVIKGSYGQAAESISEATGTPVFKQQVEFITVQAGADFDAFYEQNLSPEKIEEAMKAPLLILTTDAKGIIMRKGDLRPATRKKAEEQRHKLDKRLSPGEKKNSKRMAQVASVYNIEPQIRTAQDFRRELSNLRDVDEEPRPKPLAKRVWASVEKEPERVVQEMFEEAVRRDEKKKKTWVALVDGCPRQIARIETQAKVQGVDVTIVCDIIHVLEYVWKAAWAFFSKGDLKAQEWVTERFRANA